MAIYCGFYLRNAVHSDIIETVTCTTYVNVISTGFICFSVSDDIHNYFSNINYKIQ